jgi:hypothetical protein
MPRWQTFIAVVLLAILQWFVISCLFAEAHEPSYRVKERSAVRTEYMLAPSETTRTAFEVEVSLCTSTKRS